MTLVLLILQTITLSANKNLNFTYQETYSSKNKIEFYQNIDIAISPDNNLFVLDIGNKRVVKLDTNYREMLRFGKDGNGPGEFNRVFNIIATENRLVVNGFKKWLFDFDANYKGELILVGANCVFEDDGIIKLAKAKSGKIHTFRYTLDGGKLDPNSSYTIENKFIPNQKRMSGLRYNNKQKAFSGYYNGVYEFFIKNDQTDQIYKRIYERKPYENFDDLVFVSPEPGLDMKKYRAESIKQFLQLNGEFRSDINSVFGNYQNYLFVQTSTNDQKELKFDLVDLSTNTYKEFSLISKDKVLRTRLFKDKLIICYKSDESGPYFNVYNYQIK